jgi:hypothetical protein
LVCDPPGQLSFCDWTRLDKENAKNSRLGPHIIIDGFAKISNAQQIYRQGLTSTRDNLREAERQPVRSVSTKTSDRLFEECPFVDLQGIMDALKACPSEV